MAVGDVLIIGKGAREQALAWKLRQSLFVKKIYIAPGNAGTLRDCENVPLEVVNIKGLLAFALEKEIDLTVVGPELPLEMGIVDRFMKQKLDIFGPTRAAARLETSKVFAKYMMVRARIPTAPFHVFNSYRQAAYYICQREFPFVVKVNGLAGGKGVTVCKSIEEAQIALQKAMIERIYGKSGDWVIIEDYLSGEEVSIHAVSRENMVIMLPPSRDKKKLYNGDFGPNTGGNGCI